jgi:hypothetical protein
MKELIYRFLPLADILLAPFVYPSAWLLKNVRHAGVQRLPNCKNALMKIGVFPIRDHYYEPQFDHRNTKKPLSQDRTLPGIDWNTPEQLKILSEFSFSRELAGIPKKKPDTLDFYFDNGTFGFGDAEYWYQLIRSTKPKRVFEVGSGNSTLMAIKAIQKNQRQDPNYRCKHVCIEPYEMPWLEAMDVSVVRKKIEEVGPVFFSELEENDILFIDSSHIIRPQGDVLFEYLELLPTLNKGVVVHLHDIFSPKNYPKQWLEDEVRFWNEQYLLEAFLSHNYKWKIMGALNFLYHNYYEDLKLAAPFLTPDWEPASFYIRRTA